MYDHHHWQGERPHLELEFSNLELGPEVDAEFLLHHTLCALLLCSLDPFQLKVPESDAHLSRSCMILHVSLSIENLSRTELLSFTTTMCRRVEELRSLQLRDDVYADT